MRNSDLHAFDLHDECVSSRAPGAARRLLRTPLVLVLCTTLSWALPAAGRPHGGPGATAARSAVRSPSSAGRDYVFSGWWHDEGELLLHVSNAGYVGRSWLSDEPSAEWPAGSNFEHLYAAGIWVGAGSGVPGAPLVSTTGYGGEFLPRFSNPADIIYETTAGAAGGERLSDDDGDGATDEDRLDGIDNDLDGLIDEDYAAISDQMFAHACFDTCALMYNPPSDPHVPLGLALYERSFVWARPLVDDAVGVTYEVTNVGTFALAGVYVGIMADPDVGYDDPDLAPWDDDYVRYEESPLPSETAAWPQRTVRIAYAYDREGGLDGTAEGYFGVIVLGHTTDPSGLTAPEEVGVRAYRDFSVAQLPTSDAARYAALSASIIDPPPTVAQDWKLLLSTGPYVLEPGATVTLDVAYVCGRWLDGLRANAGRIAHVYEGYYDKPLGARVHWVHAADGPGSRAWDPAGIAAAPRPGPALSLAPCPATDRAHVSFTLDAAGRVEIDVYSVAGRRVASLARGEYGPGLHEASWDVAASGVRSGVYFVKMKGAGFERTEKLLVLR